MKNTKPEDFVRFEAKSFEPAAGNARWISYPYKGFDTAKGVPAPYFIKTFHVNALPEKAFIRICGLGYFELSINGRRVSDEVLNPPFTRYDATCLYSTYDIEGFLVPGENVIGVVLGNGMYNPFAKNVWDFEKAPWRHYPKLLMEARLVFADGKTLELASDPSFLCASGPIVSDNLYEGEIYDARLEIPGWDKPGYQEEGWQNAVITRAPGGLLKPMDMEPCRIVGRIKPVAYWEVAPGVWLFDMGINMTGWVKLRVKGSEGTAVTLKFGEMLTEDKDLDNSLIQIFADKDKFQMDTYILKGKGEEEWEPRFTYHGFQYVRVEGFPGTPDLNSLEGCVVNTDLKIRGGFSCSNPLLDKIQEAARLSTLGNYVGIPTDCPHREKNGWTGDAALSAEQVLFNFDPVRSYKKWLEDIKDCQRPSGQLPGIAPTGGWGFNWGSGPAWDCVLAVIPWSVYLYDGDIRILEENYDAMKRYLDYATGMTYNHIADFGLGDWCPPNGGAGGSPCPVGVTDTAIYQSLLVIQSKAAAILDKEEDRAFYSDLAESVRLAFNREFVDAHTGEVTGKCQTSYACALYFELLEPEVREKTLNLLIEEVERRDRHIDCGILGAKYVMQVLTDANRADLAYAMAAQTTFPSWGHWISQGATTLWETWDGRASRNHHMFSDVSAWFYKGLAGINPDPDYPGFRRFFIRPNGISELDRAEAWHDCAYGRIEVSWQVKDGVFTLHTQIPEGTEARILLPGRCEQSPGSIPVDLSGRTEQPPESTPVDLLWKVELPGKSEDKWGKYTKRKVIDVRAGKHSFITRL